MSDHDRPLNSRGKRDAPRIGQLIKDEGLVPDRILTSTAKRARKTAAKVANSCGFAAEVEKVSQLYLANPDTYANVLSEMDGDAERVLVVGHNPGLEDLVELLTEEAEVMPTAALAQVEVDIWRWSEFKVDAPAKLVHLWRPREMGPID